MTDIKKKLKDVYKPNTRFSIQISEKEILIHIAIIVVQTISQQHQIKTRVLYY
jgi:hypothetical protein